jgi:hypothetical protein
MAEAFSNRSRGLAQPRLIAAAPETPAPWFKGHSQSEGERLRLSRVVAANGKKRLDQGSGRSIPSFFTWLEN